MNSYLAEEHNFLQWKQWITNWRIATSHHAELLLCFHRLSSSLLNMSCSWPECNTWCEKNLKDWKCTFHLKSYHTQSNFWHKSSSCQSTQNFTTKNKNKMFLWLQKQLWQWAKLKLLPSLLRLSGCVASFKQNCCWICNNGRACL